MSTVYALLVGINEYRNETISTLRGCVDDIKAVHDLLSSRVGPTLQARTLLNGEATRAAIIDGFSSHLAQAGKDDIALFYYCGHGSHEPTPPEWKDFDPSGALQTIVPTDARVDGVFEIADKELSSLIKPLADTGAHVVTIFDSCNSGGVTRSLDADEPIPSYTRMTPGTSKPRQLSEFLPAAVAMYSAERRKADGPPAPSHIAIAACQHFETAKEWPRMAPKRGAFTVAFEEAMAALGPTATYVDLVNAVRTKVRSRASEQQPLLTVVGAANGTSRFLGGKAGRRDLSVNIDDTGAIWLSAGAAQGVGETKQGASTSVAIHARGAFDDPSATPTPIATATVIETQADRARLQLDGAATLDPAQAYIGVITRLSTPQLMVQVTGAPDASAQAVRDALAQRSGLFMLTEAPVDGVPCLSATVDETYTTLSDDAGVALVGMQFAHTDNERRALADCVVHLAHWYGTRDRTPVASTLNDVVKIEIIPCLENETIVPDDRPAVAATNGTIVTTYNGELGFYNRIRLRNTSARDLFVSLVALGPSRSVYLAFNDWIPAGGVGVANDGQTLYLSIPAFMADANECVNTIKVFAAIAPIDGDALRLPKLLGESTRDMGDARARKPQDASFWGTTTLHVTTQRKSVS